MVESVSRYSRQLKRNLKKDDITHEDTNNPEAQSPSNSNQIEEPVNVGENFVDLINESENDEKSLSDFESTSLVMHTHRLMSQLTSLTFKRKNLLPLI